MLDVEKFVAGLHEYIAKALAPLAGRIAAMEKASTDLTTLNCGLHDKHIERLQALEAREPQKGEPGKDADPDAIAASVVATLLAGDGLKALVDLQVAAQVAAYFEENPVQHGKSVEPAEVEAMVGKAVAAIPVPKDGQSATDEQVAASVAKYLETHAPKDGTDGVGLAGALIDRTGSLIVTTTKGEAFNLGRVIGQDGLSMADVSREYDAETHEVVERWTVAGEQKELRYPAGGIRPGGFWREGMKCHALQAITHDGALWIAKRDTASKPCLENAEDWQLAARKGRDGRDGQNAKPAPEPVKLNG